MLSGQTYVTSRISFTCVLSPKAPIYLYNQGSSSNGRAPLVSWYFFRFSSIITFSSGILSLISCVIPLVCCWVTRVVLVFLNFPPIHFIYLDRVWCYFLLCLLCTCVATVPFPASYSALARLVRYLMLSSSAWFFSDFLPEYDDCSPVIIFITFTFNVIFGHFRCRWVRRHLL